MAKKIMAADIQVCVACGVCIKSCPRGAVSIEKGCWASIDEIKCVGCGLCAKACPAGCISMKEDRC